MIFLLLALLAFLVAAAVLSATCGHLAFACRSGSVLSDIGALGAAQCEAVPNTAAVLAQSAANKQSKLGMSLFLSFAVLCIPIISGGIYYVLGQPDAVSRPFADFMQRPASALNLQEKIVRLEALAARNPRSAGTVDVLAELYLQAGRFQDAANAYTQSIALSGENEARLLGYALALTGFEDGVVGEDAEGAFRKVLHLNPQNMQAQLFLARGLVQNGKLADALALLRQCLQQTPEDSPQRQNLLAAVAVLETPQSANAKNLFAAKTPLAAVTGADKGDSAETGINHQESRISAEQSSFIAANLGKLEAKLQAEPNDVRGWTMLLRAYLLLGREDKAAAALQKAMMQLTPGDFAVLRAFATEKGFKIP